MGKKVGKITSILLYVLAIALLAGYIAMFAYLNIAKYTEHVDSDIASEAMLAREIWEQKDISPDTWVSSTERKIFSLATIAALFYGISGNMNGSMGVACIIGMLAVLLSFAYLLKSAGVSIKGIGVGLLMILALPINGMRIRDEMIPYFAYMFYAFAGYYVPYIVLFTLSLGVFIRLIKQEKNVVTYIVGIFTWLLALPLGASGLHSAQIGIVPMVILTFIILYSKTERFTKKMEKEAWYAVGYAVVLVIATAIGLLYPSSSAYPTLLLEPKLIPSKFLEAIGGVLECLGLQGNAALSSMNGIMQLLVWGIIILTVCMIVYFIRQKKESKEEQVILIGGLAISLLLTIFIVSITNAVAYYYYFFIVIFLVAAIFAIFVSRAGDTLKILVKLVLGVVIVQSLCNMVYTYIPAAASKENLQAYEEVAEVLEDNNYEYSYAQFWDANRLVGITNGALKVGNIYDVGNICMYWWLTDQRWYVPNVPADMTVAYIIEQGQEEKFLANFEAESIKQIYENDRFLIYECDHNDMVMYK